MPVIIFFCPFLPSFRINRHPLSYLLFFPALFSISDMATNSKQKSSFEVSSHTDEVFEMQPVPRLGGTNHDDHDMQVLGRTQQLNV